MVLEKTGRRIGWGSSDLAVKEPARLPTKHQHAMQHPPQQTPASPNYDAGSPDGEVASLSLLNQLWNFRFIPDPVGAEERREEGEKDDDRREAGPAPPQRCTSCWICARPADGGSVRHRSRSYKGAQCTFKKVHDVIMT